MTPTGRADAGAGAGGRGSAARLDVRKTYKLYVGGKFPRSESGRSYEVLDHRSRFLAHAALASRKDGRDAVVAARAAVAGWSGATAYNRGQVLYRVAEMVEGRRDQFAAEVVAGEGLTAARARWAVDAAVDRWVWYAGWADKFQQVDGAANPVAGPYFNFSVPEPSGIVVLLAPQRSSLLGLVATLAPVIVSGNACVVVASERAPLPAVTLAEVLATSDLPDGVVNVLTGRVAELGPTLADHLDVNGLDLTGAVDDVEQATDLATRAAENTKRVLVPRSDEPDWSRPPAGPHRILRWCETKTVWHPVGT